jgi:hypothetical protein
MAVPPLPLSLPLPAKKSNQPVVEGEKHPKKREIFLDYR